MSGYIDSHDVVGAVEPRKLFDKLSAGHLERIGAIPIASEEAASNTVRQLTEEY
jgi:hypothetical protein